MKKREKYYTKYMHDNLKNLLILDIYLNLVIKSTSLELLKKN